MTICGLTSLLEGPMQHSFTKRQTSQTSTTRLTMRLMRMAAISRQAGPQMEATSVVGVLLIMERQYIVTNRQMACAKWQILARQLWKAWAQGRFTRLQSRKAMESPITMRDDMESSFMVETYSPMPERQSMVITKQSLYTTPGLNFSLNSPKPVSSVHMSPKAINTGNMSAKTAAVVPAEQRESSLGAQVKCMPAEYAKLKQLKRMSVRSTSLSILLANLWREGAQLRQQQVRAQRKKATAMTTTTMASMTLQLRRKFASYPMDQTRLGVKLL